MKKSHTKTTTQAIWIHFIYIIFRMLQKTFAIYIFIMYSVFIFISLHYFNCQYKTYGAMHVKHSKTHYERKSMIKKGTNCWPKKQKKSNIINTTESYFHLMNYEKSTFQPL